LSESLAGRRISGRLGMEEAEERGLSTDFSERQEEAGRDS
jgi:hypothetical protein